MNALGHKPTVARMHGHLFSKGVKVSNCWRILTWKNSQVVLSPTSALDPEFTLVSRLVFLLDAVLLAAGLSSARAPTKALVRNRTFELKVE
ncbi:hypothetical protein OF83DRAFT_1179816 [Amylostereum chailletii]|nr:hypothetical protein OF83DRAFT_1179816 [Amylostereum chailletii]